MPVLFKRILNNTFQIKPKRTIKQESVEQRQISMQVLASRDKFLKQRIKLLKKRKVYTLKIKWHVSFTKQLVEFSQSMNRINPNAPNPTKRGKKQKAKEKTKLAPNNQPWCGGSMASSAAVLSPTIKGPGSNSTLSNIRKHHPWNPKHAAQHRSNVCIASRWACAKLCNFKPKQLDFQFLPWMLK